MRINKFLSDRGICSRRQADRSIEEGRVYINGKKALVGQQIDPEKDEISYDGKRVCQKPEKVVVAYNKPPGVVCSTVSQKNEINIISALGIDMRLFPIGRLDKDSRGIILLTNDGELSDKVLRSMNGHEKEYLIRISDEFSKEEIDEIEAGGISLEEGRRTKPCRMRRVGNKEYAIILTEGMNRQIRKICERYGREVYDLKRIRFVNICLDGLKEGQYRYLSEEEKNGLYQKIQ